MSLFKNILKKLNINENSSEGNNNIKYLENQIENLQNQQKINIIKNNQLIEEIHEIENKNFNKNNRSIKLKKEFESLKNEYNKLNNNITDNSNDFDKDNIDKITSKKKKFKF